MTIAVVGATGTAGSRVVAQLEQAGRQVTPLSRASGIDLHTGAGLVETLGGSKVVIDTSNPFPADPKGNLVETLSDATRRLIEASTQAGVEHLVFLSICNIDSPAFDAFPYYLAKRAQEQVVKDSGLSTTIIRSTQWHEFATNPAAVTFHDHRVDVEDWLIQPITADTVARILIDAATDRPEIRQIAGPEQIRLPDLTTAYLNFQADTRRVQSVPASLPQLTEGILLAPAEADRLGPTTREWIEHLHR